MTKTSKDKQYYDGSVANLSVAALERHYSNVRKYVATYESRLRECSGGRPLRVLEAGAGTCVTSLILSKLNVVAEIVCLDISLKKMREVFPTSVRAAGDCLPEKLSMVEGHFDAPLPFSDSEFDVVVFDGALHHARSIWLVLEECRRVLRPDGILIAQREQYLGALTASIKLDKLLQTPEVRAGVSENAYLRAQYEYYLRAAGFDSIKFLAVAETYWQALLRPFNGLLFSKWVIWARAPT